MDVLITMTREPQVDGSDIYIWFMATARESDGTVHQLPFRVAMAWGTTLAAKRSAILAAASADATAYFTAHGRAMPVVNRIEIVGI